MIEKKWITLTLFITLSAILFVLFLYEISNGLFPSYLFSTLITVLGILGLIAHTQLKFQKANDEFDRLNKLNFSFSRFKVLLGSVALIMIGLILLLGK